MVLLQFRKGTTLWPVSKNAALKQPVSGPKAARKGTNLARRGTPYGLLTGLGSGQW